MEADQVLLHTADGPMPAFEANPDTEARGAIVVVQEAFGITNHIQDICRRLATQGWLALAPALFHRDGSPELEYGDMDAVREYMSNLSAETINADIDAALAYVESEGHDAAHTGIIGFCMGGNVALVTGTRHALGAAVTFYGGGIASGRFGYPPLVELAPELKSPWFGAFGDLDKGIPVAEVEALREAAAKSSVPTELVRYPDAGHGFNCNDRESYEPNSAADAWSRATTWFDHHLAS